MPDGRIEYRRSAQRKIIRLPVAPIEGADQGQDGEELESALGDCDYVKPNRQTSSGLAAQLKETSIKPWRWVV